MAKKGKYVKIGEKAFSFSDHRVGFNLVKGQIKELKTLEQRRSTKVKKALQGGHLAIASQAEFDRFNKVPTTDTTGQDIDDDVELTLLEKLEEMTKADLTKHYEDNYEVDEDEVEAFGKLKKAEMVEELTELAEEE